MPHPGASVIEIFIRDDISARLEDMRQKFRRDQHTFFGKARHEFGEFAEHARQVGDRVKEEIRSVGEIIGINGLIGAGFVATLAKVSRALGDFSREGLNTHYAASQFDITAGELKRLIYGGEALGMTAERSQGNVMRMLSALQDLKQHRIHSQLFQELSKGLGGPKLGLDLMQAMEGPGGLMAGLRLAIERMRQMGPDAQAAFAKMLGLDSVAFRELLEVLPRLNEGLEPTVAQLRAYLLAQTNLGISFDNIKVRLGSALMPVFERLVTSIDTWLQGPGQQVVARFKAWLDTLNVDWGALFRRIGAGIKAIGNFFLGVLDFFADVDPWIQKIGGWKPVIEGLAAAGFAVWLLGLARGFKAIAALAFVFPLLGKLGEALTGQAAAAPAKKPEEGGEGAEGAKQPHPPRQRVPSASGVVPQRQDFPGVLTPRAAADERRINRDMRKVVRETTGELERLNRYLGLAPGGAGGPGGETVGEAGAAARGPGGGPGGGPGAGPGGGGEDTLKGAPTRGDGRTGAPSDRPPSSDTAPEIPVEGGQYPPSPVTGTLGQGLGAYRGAYGGLAAHRHAGFDIMAPTGTPVYALGEGTVVKAQYQRGATGGIVVVRYANGIEAKYMHLSDWTLVKPGDKVAAGQNIGKVGSSPAAPGSGSHLHLEYRRQSQLLDPAVVHGWGTAGPGGGGLLGRKVRAGAGGSLARGAPPPPAVEARPRGPFRPQRQDFPPGPGPLQPPSPVLGGRRAGAWAGAKAHAYARWLQDQMKIGADEPYYAPSGRIGESGFWGTYEEGEGRASRGNVQRFIESLTNNPAERQREIEEYQLEEAPRNQELQTRGASTSVIDRMMARRRRHQLNLNINVRAPSGTGVDAEADGAFEGNTRVSRERKRAEPEVDHPNVGAG